MTGLISKILRMPSQRTMMEANLVGIVCFILISLATSITMVFFTEIGLILKILTVVGEIGILLMLLANLATSYIQYYAYKLSMGLYPPDLKLIFKIQEAETLRDELTQIINENKQNPLVPKDLNTLIESINKEVLK